VSAFDPDAYIEAYAEVLDEVIFGGVGDILRDTWRNLWHHMTDEKPRELACVSCAAHELEFYA
jgi:hypothetical protein